MSESNSGHSGVSMRSVRSINSAGSTEEGRQALIIGQQNYQYLDGKISSIANAELLEKTFKELEFQTTLLINQTNQDLALKIKDFASNLRKNDICFFYFCGRSAQQMDYKSHQTDNFLFGIDAGLRTKSKNKGGTKKETIEGIPLVSQVFGQCFLKKCLYLIVLDCERSFPKPNQNIEVFPRQSGKHALPIQAQCDILYACQPGDQVMEVAESGVGYLAGALSASLSKPGQWTEVLQETVRQVQKQTQLQQIPQIQSNIGRKIILSYKQMMPQQIVEPDSEQIFTESNLGILLNSIQNGVAFNQIVKIGIKSDKFINDNFVYDDAIQVCSRAETVLIKRVKIISKKQCKIHLYARQSQTVLIEDCFFQGVSLQINYVKQLCHSKLFLRRVKIADSPFGGLEIKNLRRVQFENVTLQQCGTAGFVFENIEEVKITNCNIIEIRGRALDMRNVKSLFIQDVDVDLCHDNESFHFQNSKGVLKFCRYRNCKEGILKEGECSIKSISVFRL